ncbi:hypothetical protein C5167_004365 [Papaver somniferum]|uniref:Pectin acetylesterase n=1 Tax=Papaver somniferum TaxID=3469 RepID=A0A4Y7J7E5_PAPSO|nr:hypothetical protein C5167_004365 [Papaver somniferum]
MFQIFIIGIELRLIIAMEGHFLGTLCIKMGGQRIWKAIVDDLLPKGLNVADKALLSGCSAGGLATFLHCDNFTSYLPKTATVKCMSDAGVFLDIMDINLNYKAREFFRKLVVLQGAEQFLNENCTTSRSLVNLHGEQKFPYQCFFPQYALPYVKAPYFILNTVYDDYQIGHHLVPPYTDPNKVWEQCKNNHTACNQHQLNILQDSLLTVLIKALNMNLQTIAEAVGDWYFERRETKLVGCDKYPCDGSSCHNTKG